MKIMEQAIKITKEPVKGVIIDECQEGVSEGWGRGHERPVRQGMSSGIDEKERWRAAKMGTEE